MAVRILVVCHGNINRSPLAEAVVKKDVADERLSIYVKSAGFVNPGRRAAKKTRDAAWNRGYSLEDHRSQLVTREMLEWSTLVVYMDGGNLRRLGSLLNVVELENIAASCLGDWARPRVRRIPDPAFMRMDSDEFSDTINLIVRASRNFGESL